MPRSDLALMAHLLRRAGFGATRQELETYAAKGYEDTVEDLVNPERCPPFDDDIMSRYYGGEPFNLWTAQWIYRMVASKRPLTEKMALFWHHVFATGYSKVEHVPSVTGQAEMFRKFGLSDFRTLLIELSKDPAMIYWLDNNENKNGEPNENYGRELLELFSMGVGNYTEDDIKNASRAFTGWTFIQPMSVYPQGNFTAEFVFKPEEHDFGEKIFLGHTGNFNGEDIIDIIVEQEATARFISRHLYNFFVADEPQVPAWSVDPPQDPEAIDHLVKTYFESNGDMRSIMRALFNSDYFKEAAFRKVKSPTELVAGVLKLGGTFTFPRPGIMQYHNAARLMGQELLNPPTVEGWHTGKEWIDGGTLNERVNFAVEHIGDADKPGVQAIIDRIGSDSSQLSPQEFTDECLDLVGPLDVGEETRETLLEYAASGGTLDMSSTEKREESIPRITYMLQMIVSSKEFQFA